MSRRAPIRELLLGAGLAVAIFACTSAPKAVQPVQPPPAPVIQENPWLSDINTRMQDIRNWRSEMGLRIEPSRKQIMSAVQYRIGPAMCPGNEPDSPTCETKCTLAQDICDNAAAVCRIAEEELKGNSWAAGECQSARASCKEASQKCCSCNEENGNDTEASGSW